MMGKCTLLQVKILKLVEKYLQKLQTLQVPLELQFLKQWKMH